MRASTLSSHRVRVPRLDLIFAWACVLAPSRSSPQCSVLSPRTALSVVPQISRSSHGSQSSPSASLKLNIPFTFFFLLLPTPSFVLAPLSALSGSASSSAPEAVPTSFRLLVLGLAWSRGLARLEGAERGADGFEGAVECWGGGDWEGLPAARGVSGWTMGRAKRLTRISADSSKFGAKEEQVDRRLDHKLDHKLDRAKWSRSWRRDRSRDEDEQR